MAPVKPRKMVNLFVSIAMGALLAFFLAALVERLDDRVHSEDEAVRTIQLPILTRVPQIDNRILLGEGITDNLLRESFRMLRTNISFLAIDAPIRSIVITSTQPGEGKSMCSAYTAITAAQGGERVILVDCDLRRPSLHRLLELPNKVGFSSVVSGACSLDEALQETAIPNLYVLTSGPVPPDPFAMLKSRASRACLQEIFDRADLTVIDTPPAMVMVDAQILASMVDASLLVVSCQDANKRDVTRTRDLLIHTGTDLLGVILNKMPVGVGGYYGYGYYNKYHYSNNYFAPPEETEASEPALNGSSNGSPKGASNGASDGKVYTDTKA
jgi:receptor protein-tyrosine kinase